MTFSLRRLSIDHLNSNVPSVHSGIPFASDVLAVPIRNEWPLYLVQSMPAFVNLSFTIFTSIYRERGAPLVLSKGASSCSHTARNANIAATGYDLFPIFPTNRSTLSLCWSIFDFLILTSPWKIRPITSWQMCQHQEGGNNSHCETVQQLLLMAVKVPDAVSTLSSHRWFLLKYLHVFWW